MKKKFYAIPVAIIVIVLVAIFGFSYAVYNPYLTPYLPGSSATTGLTFCKSKIANYGANHNEQCLSCLR